MANITTAGTSDFPTSLDTRNALTGGASGSDILVEHYNGGAASIINIETVLGVRKTQGSILFAGASGNHAESNAQLFWDNVNNRLGIGTAAPTVALHCTGTFRAEGTGSNLVNGSLLFSSGTITAAAGTSVGGSALNLYFVGGTSSTDFNNNANSALLTRITNAGILLHGTTVTANAAAGEIVVANAKTVRGVSAAGLNTWAMISVDANNIVQLGDNANAAFVAITRGAAVAAGANNKGVLIMDTVTAGQINFYDGVTGARFKLTGTAF